MRLIVSKLVAPACEKAPDRWLQLASFRRPLNALLSCCVEAQEFSLKFHKVEHHILDHSAE
jgi:hypothetical protein